MKILGVDRGPNTSLDEDVAAAYTTLMFRVLSIFKGFRSGNGSIFKIMVISCALLFVRYIVGSFALFSS